MEDLVEVAVEYSLKEGRKTTEFIVLIAIQLISVAVSLGLITSDLAQEALPYVTLFLLGVTFLTKTYIDWRGRLKLGAMGGTANV